MSWRKCSSQQSRREFLATTLAPGIGYACLPSLATVIGNANAIANGCAPESAGTEFPAFIAIDLAGGASIAGNNVIVYKGDGTELLSSYEGLGLPSTLHPSNTGKINEDLGLKMHTDSRMLAGIRAIAPEALANTNGCVICTQTADDTSANQLATAPGIFAAGGAGSVVPLVGMQAGGAGSSGGRSANAFISSVAPTLISSPTSANSIVSPGRQWSGRERSRLDRVLRKIQNLSNRQFQRFANLDVTEQAIAMANCGYQDAVRLMSPQEGQRAEPFNPFANGNEFAGQQGVLGGQDQATAAIGYLVLKGFAGAGTITLGGYDYHNGTATTGEEQDERAGRAIGTLLEMARVLERKLMIHVYTDGGVGTGSGTEAVPGADGDVEKFTWRTDTETHSAAFVLIYDPARRPEMQTQQLGAYKDVGRDAAVDIASTVRHAKISNSAHGQASVVVGNWLAWQTSDYANKFTTVNSKLRSGAVINNQELDGYLFVPKASG